MARNMVIRIEGIDHVLGEVETRGGMHLVQLSPASRVLYLDNKPDTVLVQLVKGDVLEVRASFLRNAPDWSIIGNAPERVPAETKRAQGRANVARQEADEAEAEAAANAPAPPPAADADDDGLTGMTKAELRDACETAGVATSGTKAELIERLRAQNDANEAVE